MRRILALLLAFAFGILSSGCSKRDTEPPEAGIATSDAMRPSAPAIETETKPLEGHVVLLELEGRHHTITVTTGADGPRYSMSSSDGKVVFANLDMAQLRAQYPDISERLESAIAGKDASVGHDRR